MIRTACVVLALFASGVAEAQTRAAYTSLDRRACKTEPGAAAAARREHGLVGYRCAGAGGWSVRLTYSGAQAAAAFAMTGSPGPAYTLRAPFDVGPRIEWRSRPGAAPHAAIVRVHARTGPASTASTLAVLRLSQARVCLVVLNPLPSFSLNQRARDIADVDEPCPPQGSGAKSLPPFVAEIRDLNGP